MGRSQRRTRPRGLQAEVLLGLALLTATATGLLLAVGLRIQESQLDQLRRLAARSLIADASAAIAFELQGGDAWWVSVEGEALSRGTSRAIDPESLALAEASHERGELLMQSGAPWEPLRFAAPAGASGVSVLRLPPAASPALLAGLVLGSVTILTAFGATVLRARVVAPLQRLASGVRAVAGGHLDARVAEEGVAETAEVAGAFNEMAESLAARTRALEKAVADLRESNESLRTARAGLDRAERLAAVGRLASGVAHEVGNPMGALLAFLDLVDRDPRLGEEGKTHLAKARREGERVRSILRELLDFSRPARGVPEPVELGPLVEETVDLVRAQRRYAGIDFRVEATPDLPVALAERSALLQALLNLLVNAADAVSEGGGRVRVALRPGVAHRRRGDEEAASVGRRTLDAVEVRIEDDGPGIDPEDRERIFDPFFTTKDPGQGTGLGLSNAQRVAEQQGGRLDLVDAETLGGACFALQLPAALRETGDSVRRA